MGQQASQAVRQPAANADLADAGLPGYTLLQIQAVLRQGPVYAAVREDDGVIVSVLEYCPSQQARRTASGVRPLQGQTLAFEQGLKDFQHESRMLARVDHPGLIRVLEHLHARGTGYRVMPAWRGKLLSTLLAEPPDQRDQAGLLSLLDGLTSVLRSLHKRHSVHGWLSPDSILMIEPPNYGELSDRKAPANPVMLDLGRAGLLPGSSRQIEFHPVSQLQAWLAPEALHAQSSEQLRMIGPWTDIYGLAAMLHQWISGEQPQPAASRLMMDLQQAVAVWQGSHYDHQTLQAVDIGLALAPKDRGRSVESWRRRFPGGAHTQRNLTLASSTTQAGTGSASAANREARAHVVSSRPGKVVSAPDPALLAMLAAGRAAVAATEADAPSSPNDAPLRSGPARADGVASSGPAAGQAAQAHNGAQGANARADARMNARMHARDLAQTKTRAHAGAQRVRTARRWLGPSGPSNLALLTLLALASVALLLTATLMRQTDDDDAAAPAQQSGAAPASAITIPTIGAAKDQAKSAGASTSGDQATSPAKPSAPKAVTPQATLTPQATALPQRSSAAEHDAAATSGARAVGQIRQVRRVCDDIMLRISLGGALTPDELNTLKTQCR